MAYTTPTTRSTGNSISAANWNADVVDDVKWLAGDTGGKPSCRVYNSSSIATVTATLTLLTFNSERWDNGGMHSTAVSTGRITIPSGGAGKYLIGANVLFDINGTGVRTMNIYLNGTTIIATDSRAAAAAATYGTGISITTLYSLAATDYLEVTVIQTSGGNLNVNASSAHSPEFYAIWQGL